MLQNVGRQNNDSDCGAFVLQVCFSFVNKLFFEHYIYFGGCISLICSIYVQSNSDKNAHYLHSAT